MTDLTPLANLPLTSLDLSSCALGDLGQLASHPTLKDILIFTSTGGDTVDVRPLADLDITLTVWPESRMTGLDELGPNVKIIR